MAKQTMEDPIVKRKLVGEGVTTITVDGNKTENQEDFAVTVAGPSEEVEFGLGLTINQGDFNSLRVDVRRRTACAKGDADRVFEEITAWVEQRVAQIVRENQRVRLNKF